MCKRNSLDKNEASTGCVRETPQIKRNKYGVWKRNSPDYYFFKPACVRETPQIKKKKDKKKKKPAWDV